MEYFKRQIQLWGEDAQDKLKDKSIAIIGCGGLGSSLGVALGSSGIGKIHLVDFDEVSKHNIHRQIAFKMKDEGKSKAKILKKLIRSRFNGVKVKAHKMAFEEFAKKDIKVDLILDATDNLHTRAAMNRYCKTKNVPWVYGSVEAFNGQVCFFKNSSFDAFKVTQREPAGIAAPIVMHIASLQANLAIRYFVGLSVKKDLLYYLYIDDEGELITQKFIMPKEV